MFSCNALAPSGIYWANVMIQFDDDTLLILQLLALDAKVSFISRKVAFDLYGQVELSMGCFGGLQDDDALKLALQAPMTYQVKHGCSDIDVLADVLMDAIVENQPFSKWNFEFACLAATKFKALNTFKSHR